MASWYSTPEGGSYEWRGWWGWSWWWPICFVRLDFTVNVEEQKLQLKDFDIISNQKLLK